MRMVGAWTWAGLLVTSATIALVAAEDTARACSRVDAVVSGPIAASNGDGYVAAYAFRFPTQNEYGVRAQRLDRDGRPVGAALTPLTGHARASAMWAAKDEVRIVAVDDHPYDSAIVVVAASGGERARVTVDGPKHVGEVTVAPAGDGLLAAVTLEELPANSDWVTTMELFTFDAAGAFVRRIAPAGLPAPEYGTRVSIVPWNGGVALGMVRHATRSAQIFGISNDGATVKELAHWDVDASVTPWIGLHPAGDRLYVVSPNARADEDDLGRMDLVELRTLDLAGAPSDPSIVEDLSASAAPMLRVVDDALVAAFDSGKVVTFAGDAAPRIASRAADEMPSACSSDRCIALSTGPAGPGPKVTSTLLDHRSLAPVASAITLEEVPAQTAPTRGCGDDTPNDSGAFACAAAPSRASGSRAEIGFGFVVALGALIVSRRSSRRALLARALRTTSSRRERAPLPSRAAP